jgi:UDP-GlcNAc:undecaprenyl-phosphate/decaprenyl-phosphate GlcNAc-1-phosphate transferase
MIYFPTLFLSMFITMALIPIFKTMAIRTNIVDMPNARKVHDAPMPKVGGVAFAFGALVPILFFSRYNPAGSYESFKWSVVIGAWIIVLFGFLDDVKDLGYKPKLFGQIIAALVVMLYGGLSITRLGNLLPEGYSLPVYIAMPLTLLTIVGVTNAINLADGLDGLAGGISLMSFICIGYLAYRCERSFIAMMSVAMMGGLFGFLRFNTHPATVFMGDAGSQLIGFLAITLSLGLTQGNTPLSPMLPLLLLGFPVVDTLMVMGDRKFHGRPMFVADKNHFHHKLLGLGLFHSESVLVIYVIQAVLVTFAFVFRFYSEWLLLLFYVIFLGTVFACVLRANLKGVQLTRSGVFDRVIKMRLKIFKEEQTLIKFSFIAMELVLPVLLVFSGFLSKEVPSYVSGIAVLLALMVFFTGVFFKKWAGGFLRLALYIMIPYLIYAGETDPVSWSTDGVMNYYPISFGMLAVFVILTIKFTRRTKGFKATPMDFLILFSALVLPNLPESRIQSYPMGMMATKIIVLFFSYEVWICELRGKLGRAELSAIAALLAVAVRGVL